MTGHFVQTEVLRTMRNSQINKTISLLKTLRNTTLTVFHTASTRNVCLYFHSFGKGIIHFYSAELNGLIIITSREQKEKLN